MRERRLAAGPGQVRGGAFARRASRERSWARRPGNGASFRRGRPARIRTKAGPQPVDAGETRAFPGHLDSRLRGNDRGGQDTPFPGHRSPVSATGHHRPISRTSLMCFAHPPGARKYTHRAPGNAGVPPACGPKRVRNRPMRARRPRTQDVRRQHPQAATGARSAGCRSCASPARPTFRSTRMTPLGTLVSRPQMGRQERRRASMRAGHERSRDAVSVGENILPPSPREGVGRRVRGRRTGGAITIPGRAAHAAARLAPGLAPVPVGPGRPRPPTRRPVRPRPSARARGPRTIPGGIG